jgi:hypothetical protein
MRRRDPQRIYAAQRAGLRARIVQQWRQSEAKADELLDRWEVEASTRGLDRGDVQYWDQAAEWIRDRI